MGECTECEDYLCEDGECDRCATKKLTEKLLDKKDTEIAELKAFTKYLHENAQTVWDEGLTLEKEYSLFKHIILEKGDGTIED